MKLGIKHLVMTLAACLAVSTMVGCGDDSDSPAVDAGYDSGAAGSEAGTGAKDSGTAGSTAGTEAKDATVPDEDGGEDGGTADAG